MEHASPNLRAQVLIAEPLFWIVWLRGGGSKLRTVLVREGRVSWRRGRTMLSLSPCVISMPPLSFRIIVPIGGVLTICIVVAIVVIIVRGGALSVASASCLPRQQRPPCFWPLRQGRGRMEETLHKLIPVIGIVRFVNSVSQGSESIDVNSVNIFEEKA